MSSNMYPHRVGFMQSVHPRAAVILDHLLPKQRRPAIGFCMDANLADRVITGICLAS